MVSFLHHVIKRDIDNLASVCCRFKQHDDGFYRLQTVRYESVEVTPDSSNSVTQNHDSSTNNGSTSKETQPKDITSCSPSPPKPSKERRNTGGPITEGRGGGGGGGGGGEETPDVTVVATVKKKNRKRKKAGEGSYSYNLEMLGDVAVKYRDKGVDGSSDKFAGDSCDSGDKPVVKLQKIDDLLDEQQPALPRKPKRKSTKPVKQQQKEPILHMPTAGEIFSICSMAHSPEKRPSRNIWQGFGQSDCDSHLSSSQEHSHDVTAMNSSLPHGVDMQFDDDSRGSVVGKLVDALGQTVYVTSNDPVSVSEPVHIIQPDNSDSDIDLVLSSKITG